MQFQDAETMGMSPDHPKDVKKSCSKEETKKESEKRIRIGKKE